MLTLPPVLDLTSVPKYPLTVLLTKLQALNLPVTDISLGNNGSTKFVLGGLTIYLTLSRALTPTEATTLANSVTSADFRERVLKSYTQLATDYAALSVQDKAKITAALPAAVAKAAPDFFKAIGVNFSVDAPVAGGESPMVFKSLMTFIPEAAIQEQEPEKILTLWGRFKRLLGR